MACRKARFGCKLRSHKPRRVVAAAWIAAVGRAAVAVEDMELENTGSDIAAEDAVVAVVVVAPQLDILEIDALPPEADTVRPDRRRFGCSYSGHG